MIARPWSPTLFREAARNIAAISQRLYEHGWSPATSSNYSMRLNADYCAVTVSGKDKGTLNEADVMVVDMQGTPASNGKPSAETGLHTQIYRRFTNIGAVLHTHSLASTVLTMHWPERSELVLSGYELLKALDGVTSHDTELVIPIFDNTQDIDALARDVDAAMANGRIRYAYLIRGHGIYTWAKDMTTCFRQIEALEVLLAVELERRKIGG
ncbi:methylthioribulose 1-phosphate dehydratase [Alcanivorax sp. 1008]|uniref:methylthioribulose 1-phosphate dehydratase n=1 Tax=Alcanivorax sp. 1008 TaxID=2816853 RepID=UPI001E0C7E5C|nr:methylthioribulose 1-phosphate dehydratase [Alcanivorax sp. 1008]MCC1496370.1 methylthioribulose 1-phosphate dehydratase [Alcanivorax sp. 1008]